MTAMIPVSSSHRLLKPADVCQRLGITDRTLRTWIADGVFPPPLANLPRPRWREQDVNRFLESL